LFSEDPSRVVVTLKSDGVFCKLQREGRVLYCTTEDNRDYSIDALKVNIKYKNFESLGRDGAWDILVTKVVERLLGNWGAEPFDGFICYDRYCSEIIGSDKKNARYLRFVPKADIKSDENGVIQHPIMNDVYYERLIPGMVYEILLVDDISMSQYCLGRYRGKKRNDNKNQQRRLAKTPTIYDLFPESRMNEKFARVSPILWQRVIEQPSVYDGSDPDPEKARLEIVKLVRARFNGM